MSTKITQKTPKIAISDHFSLSWFSIFILTISLLLALFENSGSAFYIGGWDMLVYLTLLTPLIWLILRKKVKNPYTKYLIVPLMLWIIDIYYYANNFTQKLLPLIIFMMIVTLYITSMHKVDHFYQTLIPRFGIPFSFKTYLKAFFSNLMPKNIEKNLYSRITVALWLSIPFLVLFMSLFMSADSRFNNAVSNLLTFKSPISFETMIGVPLYFLGYLLLFIYGFSNVVYKVETKTTKPYDLVVVGIFLGLLNLLFVTFLLFQLSYLFGGESYIKASGINIAEYAREGFFQLMWVMGIVMIIALTIMSRFKGEKLITVLMSGLLMQTMVMGFSSLKKMYLYQELMGATVLRYYVEWFDYFLLLMLGLGIYFFIQKKAFTMILNSVTVIGITALSIVASINVDLMVAQHNIEKFKGSNKLDKKAISRLSLDTLPALQGTEIKLVVDYRRHHRDCDTFKEYHFGNCQNVKKYGTENIRSNSKYSQ